MLVIAALCVATAITGSCCAPKPPAPPAAKRPAIVTKFPDDGWTGVSRLTRIGINFDRPMAASVGGSHLFSVELTDVGVDHATATLTIPGFDDSPPHVSAIKFVKHNGRWLVSEQNFPG